MTIPLAFSRATISLGLEVFPWETNSLAALRISMDLLCFFIFLSFELIGGLAGGFLVACHCLSFFDFGSVIEHVSVWHIGEFACIDLASLDGDDLWY